MDLNKYLNNAAPSEPQYSKEEYAAMKKTEREAVWAQVDARMGEVLADAPALQEFLNFMSQSRNSLPNQLLLSGQNADITDARTFQQWKDAGRHVLCPIRPIEQNGKWGLKQRRVYELDEDGNRIRDADGKFVFNAVPTTDWGSPETLEYWRQTWAELWTIFCPPKRQK